MPYRDQNRRSFTPFQEIMVAERETVINLNGVFGISELRDDTQIDGTGTVESVDSEYRVRHQASGDFARLTSAQRGVYIPGMGAQVGVGVRIPNEPTTGDGDIKWGYFEMEQTAGVNDKTIKNGYLFGVDKDGLYVEIWKDGTRTYRQNAADFNINNPDWIDLAQGSIFQIEYAYYGYGPIVWSIQDGEAGESSQDKYYLNSTRIDASTSLSNSNLQVGALVTSSNTSEDFSAYVAGRQFSIMGKYKPLTRKTGVTRTGYSYSDAAYTPFISFKRKVNRREVGVQPFGFDVEIDTDSIMQIRVNSDLTGASFGDIEDQKASETALERDISATAVDVSTGTKVYESYLASGIGNNQSLEISVDEILSTVPDGATVTFAIKALSGTGTANGTFRMQELY